MKHALVQVWVLCAALAAAIPLAPAQTGDRAPAGPEIEIRNCNVEATLAPDTHEIEAAATITFLPREPTDYVVLSLHENLWIRKVLSAEGLELDFEHAALGPGIVSVFFPKPLDPAREVVIRIEYKGGFDRDRFSRLYVQDESLAFIGTEGTYLMHAAKWIPAGRFSGHKVTTRMEVTVPLGMTVIGPGTPEPVITKGISETFVWKADVPIPAATMVAGRYFKREWAFDGFVLECFTKAEDLVFPQDLAREVAGILAHYRDAYGPSASGERYRLVEVDDRLAHQHGMLGTVFFTRRELEQPASSARPLARRIACQWWGETVGVGQAGDLWLEDGWAYYSAAGYLAKSGGEDAFRAEMEALAILALKFENTAPVRNGLDLGYRTDRYESVVAGKGAWILHMLRGLLGESKFDDLARAYFREGQKGNGGMALFRPLAEERYGDSLGWYFAEWVDTTGIPSLQTDYVVYKTLDGFRVSGAVSQDRDLFRMPLEIALAGKGEKTLAEIELSGRSTLFDIVAFSKPDSVVLDPNHRLLQNSTGLQASVHLALGNDRKDQGDFVGAIQSYGSALKLSPQRSLAHFRMAEVYYEQFNLQSAADSFRNALNGDLDPGWIEVWSYLYLVKIYDILGQRQRAMAEYTKAVNTKDDTNGAQAEAEKWLQAPFVRKRTIMGE